MSMNIVFCAAEVAPFAKVGGLADVVGSLPKALAQLDARILVCVPRYGCIKQEDYHLYDTGIHFQVDYGGKSYPFHVLEATLPGSNVTVFFMENEELFIRTPDVYPWGQPEFEALRYDVYAQAVFQFLQQIDWQPNILHLHDWHTAMMAAQLKQHYRHLPFFSKTGVVLSLHNMAYQGILNGVNRLHEGIVNSDALIAVSPTYAREILIPPGGAGLEEVLRQNRHKLTGILNGIDTDLFNPMTDVFIAKNYDVAMAATGKQACKEALQMEMGLEVSPDVPIFGMVTRLVEQKGLDLLLEILPKLALLPAQFVILGTGDPAYEAPLKEANAATRNIRTRIGYHTALGQHIYSGSDLFLMPSRFEPCGLGQMIALRYGTVPVVRKTGGLADSVLDFHADVIHGNGFVFEDYTGKALLSTIERAVTTWRQHGPVWKTLIQRGMSQDFSWQKSAVSYKNVYQTVCQQIKLEVTAHG